MKEGLLDIFVDAGCAVNTPSCGPCMGGHMGVMAAGEKCVSTTNRNFVSWSLTCIRFVNQSARNTLDTDLFAKKESKERHDQNQEWEKRLWR